MIILGDEEENNNDNNNHNENIRAADNIAQDLFLACQQKPLRKDIILNLLRENPEIIKSKDRQGRLPLEVACLFGSPSLEVVQCLLEHFPGAVKKVVRTNNDDEELNNNGETKNEQRLALHYACRGRAPLEVVQYLLKIEPAAIATPGHDGMLPLHEACSSDENDGRDLPPLSLPLIQFLVNKYPDALLTPSSAQLLPLHYASCTKNVPLSVIEYLVKENPNAVKASSYQGLLPLHLAAYFCESVQVFTFLYEAYPSAIGMKDACGCTCLHVACAAMASPDLIMNIISWDPESLQIEDGFGRLPLHIACLTDAPVNVIKHMTESFPQSLIMKDSEGDGDLPLDMVASRAHHASEDVIESLVLNGMPPLHFACYYNASIQTLRFLHEKYPAMITEVAGQDHFRPLHYACCSSNATSEDLLEKVDFLLEQDPDAIHARSATTGELPLHVACRHTGTPLEVIQRLFQQSPATVKCVDKNGLSPLDVACGHDAELDVIFFLVTKDPTELLRVKQKKQTL